jgi:hypothetical protein
MIPRLLTPALRYSARTNLLRRWKFQTIAGRIFWKDGDGRDLAVGVSFSGLAQALEALNKEKAM